MTKEQRLAIGLGSTLWSRAVCLLWSGEDLMRGRVAEFKHSLKLFRKSKRWPRILVEDSSVKPAVSEIDGRKHSNGKIYAYDKSHTDTSVPVEMVVCIRCSELPVALLPRSD